MGIFPNSGAEKAGLRATQYNEAGDVRLGDIILAVDDQPIESTKALLDVLEQHKVGDTVNVIVLRNKQRQSIKVTLQGE